MNVHVPVHAHVHVHAHANVHIHVYVHVHVHVNVHVRVHVRLPVKPDKNTSPNRTTQDHARWQSNYDLVFRYVFCGVTLVAPLTNISSCIRILLVRRSNL